jgi:hypothetical protein
MKRRHLSQKNFVRSNEPLGEDETIVLRTHERMLSRFSLSSPAPNKGDFFLTSRFEHRHWTRHLLNRGSQKWLTQGMTQIEEPSNC